MMRDLALPRRPVVRDVVAPEIELVANLLRRKQRRESLRRLERTRRVLPLALSAYEEQRHLGAEPAKVVPVEMLDVVDGVVEVNGVSALAPADDRHVVDAAHADREREQVGALEGEVRSVVRAEARSRHHDLSAA